MWALSRTRFLISEDMLKIVTYDLLFKHCAGLEEDEELIRHYGEVAEEMVIADTYRTEEELMEMGGGEFPARIRQAVLAVAAHMYRVREATTTVAQAMTPLSYRACILPFRAFREDWRRKEDIC